jgi:outer membrane biosynthesis protein TonB
MSLPHATRPKDGASSPRSTRQLLDELDALMDQMLALPVEEEPPPPAPAVAATLTIIEPEPEAPAPQPPAKAETIPIKRTGVPAPPIAPAEEVAEAPPWSTTEIVEKPTPSGFALVDLDDEEATNALVAPAPTPPAPSVPRQPARPMPRSSAGAMTNSLVVWDRGFRRFTRKLGPIGWFVRSDTGRVFLGMLGLAFWIIALAWLVRDWWQWPR